MSDVVVRIQQMQSGKTHRYAGLAALRFQVGRTLPKLGLSYLSG